ncbi:hypothetical protein T492DRAFT_853393, partial [Pavlovales sp. CCMP2436]
MAVLSSSRSRRAWLAVLLGLLATSALAQGPAAEASERSDEQAEPEQAEQLEGEGGSEGRELEAEADAADAADAPPVAAAEQPATSKRSGSLTTRSIYRRTAGFYAGCTAVLMPLWEPKHVDSLLRTVRSPKLVRNGVLGAASAVYNVRQKHMIPCLLVHEVITDVSADVTAQAFELEFGDDKDDDDDEAAVSPAARVPEPVAEAEVEAASGEKRLVLDWKRVGRSTTVALMSDDFPFLLWSRGLWVLSERLTTRVKKNPKLSPGTVRALTHPLTISVGKMIITQLVYESTSNALYLSLQALFRGMG